MHRVAAFGTAGDARRDGGHDGRERDGWTLADDAGHGVMLQRNNRGVKGNGAMQQ
jgi:hypothetical protein